MKFYVYIIYSATRDTYYIGQTENIEKRLSEHSLKGNLGATDWQLRYFEEYNSRGEAMKRETEIKRKKRRSYLEWLIKDKRV
jgi:putative endonuclease